MEKTPEHLLKKKGSLLLQEAYHYEPKVIDPLPQTLSVPAFHFHLGVRCSALATGIGCLSSNYNMYHITHFVIRTHALTETPPCNHRRALHLEARTDIGTKH